MAFTRAHCHARWAGRVLDKLDAAGNASVQFSGDQGLAQVLTLQQLQHSIQQVYILRPEKSIPDVRIDEYVKPYESSWFWSIVLRDWKRYIDVDVCLFNGQYFGFGDGFIFHECCMIG